MPRRPVFHLPALFLFALLLGIPASSRSAEPARPSGPEPSGTLSVQWEKFETGDFPTLKGWVVVTQGRLEIRDLSSARFRLFEDAQEQGTLRVTPETEGVAIAILLDISGSMRESLPKAQSAVREFVQLLRPQDQAVLIVFNDEARILQPLTSRKASLLQTLSGLKPDGGTALYDSVLAALKQLSGLSQRRVIVLLTDGSDQNAEGTGPGSRAALDDCLLNANFQKTSLFTIGLGIRPERQVLKTLSESTGGKSYWAAEADELKLLYREIAQYLQGRYRVVYQAQNTFRDGELRHVRLQVQDSGRFGEGRTSYWTGKGIPRIKPAGDKAPEELAPIKPPPALPATAVPTPTFSPTRTPRPAPPTSTPSPGPSSTPTPVDSGWTVKWGASVIMSLKLGRVLFFSGDLPFDPSSGKLSTWPEKKTPEAYYADGNALYLLPGRYRFAVKTGPASSIARIFEVKPGVSQRMDLPDGLAP